MYPSPVSGLGYTLFSGGNLIGSDCVEQGMSRRVIHEIMARQDGVITRDQACAHGVSTSAIDRRVRSGEWRILGNGVYLRADRPHTAAVRLRASVYGAGPGATAWGPSAAWWHGLCERPPARAFVTIPHHRTLGRGREVTLRRRDLDERDVVTVRSLAVTSLPLTVLEAAVELPDGSVLMDRALQRRTSLTALEAAHVRNSGRRGARSAHRLLCVARAGGHSEAERVLYRLLRGAGLTGWRAHAMSCGFEIYVVFDDARVAIEVDGWAWHRDAHRHRRDAERQNILVNAGWHVLRFTWHTLTQEPDEVVRQIRAALNRPR